MPILRIISSRAAPPRWVSTLLWAAWLVLLGILVLNWHRLALVPEQMNPAHAIRLAVAWVFALGLVAWFIAHRQPSLLPPMALALAGVLALPSDLWPLGVVGGLALGLAAKRPMLAWSAFLVFALFSLWGAYERIFGAISAETSSTMAQTAPSEAGYFLLHLVTPGWLVNQLVVAVTLGLAVRIEHCSDSANALRSGPIVLALLALTIPAATPGLLQRAMAIRGGLEQHQQYVRTVEQASAPAPRSATVTPMDVIWVIGESQSRAFWQLYGYPRATTPALEAIRDELLVLTDAVAPHSHTVQSLMQAAYRYRAGGDERQVSLLAMLKSAGVRVQWHTAQEQFGPWASPVVRWASGADKLVRHGSHLRLGAMRSADHPDRLAQMALFHDLASSAGGHQLLVHHMYAAHDPYCAHVPRTSGQVWRQGLMPEGWFGQTPARLEALRCYEDAVRFTDETLATYIKALRERTRPAVLVFVPDHGEDPAGGTGHNADRPSLWHLEIPVVLYANEAARRDLGSAWVQLAANADKPFLGSWVYELMLELLGVAAPDLALQSPPRMALGFHAPARVVYPHGRRWNYDDSGSAIDLMSASRNALARRPAAGRSRPALFAHRVNTVLKALQAMRDFDGIEFDVWLDPARRELLVNHPPMPVSGLRVDELLQAAASRPGLQLWLDFKNPGQAPEQAIELLGRLDDRWRLRSRAVLELPAETPEDVKAIYSKAGWAVSMYLPDRFAFCNYIGAGNSECSQLAASWVAEARRVGLAGFSFDDALRPAVERYLRPLARDKRYLSWKLSLRADETRLADAAADLAPLDALIVSFPSQFNP